MELGMWMNFWQFDLLIKWLLSERTGCWCTGGNKGTRRFCPCHGKIFLSCHWCIILFPNHLFSHYYGVLLMCQVLGWQRYAGNCLIINFLNKILLILSICQFLWYTHSHQYWFQAINIVTSNVQLGRDAISELLASSREAAPTQTHILDTVCRSTATKT